MMITPLGAYFEELRGTDRGKLIEALMLICVTRCQQIAVVCVGAGDAFITRYWPYLQGLVNEGFVHLTVVDQYPLAVLMSTKINEAKKHTERQAMAAVLESEYLELTRMVEQGRYVHYLDLSDPLDRQRYNFMARVNVVFVLVPDDIHVKFAQPWVGRADLIAIEKPYNRNLGQAQEFEKALKEMAQVGGANAPYTVVIGIDHYLAKIFSYLRLMGLGGFHEKQIGVIKSIEYCICEPRPIEDWRISSLGAGMLYDLYPHVLAMASPFVDLTKYQVTSPSFKLLVARYKDCPIASESYAWVSNVVKDFKDRDVPIFGPVGKGVGRDQPDLSPADEKYLKLDGNGGTIWFDLDPKSAGKIFHVQNGQRNTLSVTVGKGHLELLEAIFTGSFLHSPVGGLMSAQAVQNLSIISTIRDEVEAHARVMAQTRYLYDVGTARSQIHQNAVCLSR